MNIRVNRKHRTNRGFTLLELLTVLIIVGVLAGVVILSYTNLSESRELRTHADRLMLSVELARQKSTLANEVWGLRVMPNTYEYLRLLDDGEWEVVADSLFAYHSLGRDYQMHLRLLDGPVSKRPRSTKATQPDILLLPSGETNPFEVTLTHVATKAERFVISDGIQAVVVTDQPYKTLLQIEDA